MLNWRTIWRMPWRTPDLDSEKNLLDSLMNFIEILPLWKSVGNENRVRLSIQM